MGERLRLGISSCLLGSEVRYDGGHSRDDIVLESMGDVFELIPYCPEVAIGLSIPRPPIQLVSCDGEIRVRGVDDVNQDVTEDLSNYAQSMTGQLDLISGYIFKSSSPSCGIVGVNVFDNQSGEAIGTSTGQFAKIIMRLYPELPVEDEVRLRSNVVRMDFIERIRRYAKKNRINME